MQLLRVTFCQMLTADNVRDTRNKQCGKIRQSDRSARERPRFPQYVAAFRSRGIYCEWSRIGSLVDDTKALIPSPCKNLSARSDSNRHVGIAPPVLHPRLLPCQGCNGFMGLLPSCCSCNLMESTRGTRRFVALSAIYAIEIPFRDSQDP
jgi:hypothetical protein